MTTLPTFPSRLRPVHAFSSSRTPLAASSGTPDAVPTADKSNSSGVPEAVLTTFSVIISPKYALQNECFKRGGPFLPHFRALNLSNRGSSVASAPHLDIWSSRSTSTITLGGNGANSNSGPLARRKSYDPTKPRPWFAMLNASKHTPSISGGVR